MPKFLVFSDIHRNLDAVRRLRERESNLFDAVLVAGDIGSESQAEFLSIVRTFDCPVLFVYGNWDNRSNYSEQMLAEGLIHHSIHSVGDYCVTGFSGCPTHWGLNPIFLETKKVISEKYASTLEQYRSLVEQRDIAKKEAEREFAESVGKKIERLNARTKDRRSADYRQSVDKIRSSSARASDRNWDLLDAPRRKYVQSDEYQAYLKEFKIEKAQVLERNRQRLDELRSECDAKRTIIMTHERLYRLQECAPLLHVFGHRHTFQHTVFHDTHCVNVAALDNHDDWISDGLLVADPSFASKLSGYCIITINDEVVSVERNNLRDVKVSNGGDHRSVSQSEASDC